MPYKTVHQRLPDIWTDRWRAHLNKGPRKSMCRTVYMCVMEFLFESKLNVMFQLLVDLFSLFGPVIHTYAELPGYKYLPKKFVTICAQWKILTSKFLNTKYDQSIVDFRVDIDHIGWFSYVYF